MSSDELFAHSTLSADDSRLFLLCDALCPYFPNVYLARLLENLSIRPGTGKRWDNASVLQTRKHFVKSKELYADTDWQKFKDEQLHFELSCQAAEQPEIVRALTVLLPQLGLSESVRRQWIYLLLFLKAFPKGTNVPPIEETPLIDVFVTVLPHVTFTHEWLDQRQPLAKRWICLENALFLLYEGTPWKSWGVVCDYMQDHVIEDLYHSHVYYAVIRILQGKDYNQENLTSGLNEKELCLLSACASLMKGEVEEAYQSFHGMAVDWSKQHSVQDYPVLPDFYGVLFYFAQLRHKQDLSNFIPTCKSIYRRFATWDDFTNESISYLVLQDLYTLRYGNTTQFTAAADYGQNEESKKYHLKHASLFTRLLFFHGALSCSDDEDMKWCKSAIALRDAYRDVFPLVYNLLNDLLREVGESSKENLPVAYDPWLRAPSSGNGR